MIIFASAFAGEEFLIEEGFDLFYNYRYRETEEWLNEKINNKQDVLKTRMFLVYNEIRSSLANAQYEGLNERVDAMIALYEPSFKAYLKIHPEDVDAQFYYAAMLGGKMRLHLHDMSYGRILKEGPPILLVKTRIDRYSRDYPDMLFGTGAFQYYSSQFVSIRGLSGTMNGTRLNGIADVWKAYREGPLTRWEAAIVLMYIYLYDEYDMTVCKELGEAFLDRYPENIEMLALYAEALYIDGDYGKGDKMVKRMSRIAADGRLENSENADYRITYLKGISAMLSGEYDSALDSFENLLDKEMEYSWYHAITLKYMGDIYMETGRRDQAREAYRRTVETRELIGHVAEARDRLKILK